ncbi:hypothetical protein NPIL_681771 [Nephila pilipes]|uniref:Uncharacterized protein n=1 Tax=Nephila pilipes TaxID=299642 RepID=A0A8X6Q0B8_NEPPI|nr:hypothetical protein NPIL_681771 [Nephila pilipes]
MTVETTGLRFTKRNEHSNRYLTENRSGIPIPFKGERTLEEMKRFIRSMYRLKYQGRRLLVAVLGIEQEKFFNECGILAADLHKLEGRYPEFEYDRPLLQPVDSSSPGRLKVFKENRARFCEICQSKARTGNVVRGDQRRRWKC